MTYKLAKIFLALSMVVFAAVPLRGQNDAKTIARVASIHDVSDSLLQLYSIDELLTYKKYYEGERVRLEEERQKLRDKGIEDLEAFIRSHPESNVLDKVVFRLAELYYDKSIEDYGRAQEAYGKALDMFDAGRLAEPPQEPKKDFSRSLALYQYILDRFPTSSLLDDAAYNIAFTNEDQGKREEAIALYEEFLENFPTSRYTPEVLMRQAEYYFNPPVNQLERAIEIYQKILAYTDSPRYDEALYRLGWSYYRLNDYPKAISYFTQLADDIEQARDFDPMNKITNPSLKEESVEYIGISFLDYHGVPAAENYLKDIGGRDYGITILRKIGDSYLEVKEEYTKAIEAYSTILKLYPFAEQAPTIKAKIAKAYRKMEDDEHAYVQRKELFEAYKKGSDWWEHVTDKNARTVALELAEHALRANINLLLDTANENGNKNLYAQAVDDSRLYLEAFPKDTNAVRIHWNMALVLDAKLKMPNSALDEYIKISNLYWDSPFQKEAARNAVALAQDFVAADSAQATAEVLPLTLAEMRAQDDKNRLRKTLQFAPRPLSAGEEKLVRAINNFIKLFPYEQESAERLSQAGSIYYNKNEFANALKYFKTLLKHFPTDSLAEYAEYLIMESYFGELDYPDVEIVARRLRDKSSSAAYQAKANQRLAESIFLQAESLADSAEHFKAAEEYRRVADEVPHAEFADLALFRAGLEFDQAKEFRRAVEIYSRISENFPNSAHYLPALNNMALDFGEVKDFENAALTFERLGEEDTTASKVETHLYNASYFFEQAEDWERAIRVNRKFVDRFPDSKDADDMFYNIANYYLKLGDIDKANEIYGEYGVKFPDSPRVVETFYRRGEYFESQADIAAAKSEYEKAIAKSDEFLQAGKDVNAYFAAEALFRLTELQFSDYLAISFRLPLPAMQESKKKKKDLLIAIVDGYAKVASYTTTRLYEATYKIGLAYEDFAKTWAEQEIPPTDETKRIVARKEINQTAAELYERALDAYKNSATVLSRIVDQFRESMADTTALPRHSGEKIAATDSTLQIATRWINRSKEKISETIFNIAEINHSSVTELLDAPLPPGLDALTALEFRNQLIGKFVRPLVDEIVGSHIRNLREARELNLDNDWVAQSRGRIVTTNRILGDQYGELSWQALRGYQGLIGPYKTALTDDPTMALGIADEMANFIDFSKAFSRATIESYKQTIERARGENIRSAELVQLQDAVFEYIFNFASAEDSLAAVADNERKIDLDLFQKTNTEAFQEGAFAFEDNYFSWNEAAKNLLATGFQVSQEFDLEGVYSEKILLALVRKDPDEYAAKLGLQVAQFTFGSDTTWRAIDTVGGNWFAVGYDDSRWRTPGIADSSMHFPGYPVSAIWLTASTVAPVADSIRAKAAGPDSSLQANPAGQDSLAARLAQPASKVYFRRNLDIQGLPVSGQIQIAVDRQYAFYVNGELISEYRGPADERPHIHDFSDFLVSGKNVVALSAEKAGAAGFEFVIFLKTVPGWEKRQAEVREQKEKERENLLFDKGVLPKQKN